MGQWHVDVKDLPGQLQLTYPGIRRDGSNSASAFCEFDQRNTNIIDQCDQHTTGLFQLIKPDSKNPGGFRTHFTDLGHPQDTRHQVRNLGTVLVVNVIDRDLIFTYRTVDNGRNETILVYPEF